MAATNRLFREKHPILLGIIILGVIFLVFWGGITFFVFALSARSADFFASKDSVGIIELKGVIVSSDEIIADLTAFRKNSSIKAIVLRVDSPGGSVGAAQEIFEEVKRTKKAKPVVASMASVAASGGYYIALGADKIVANPGTLTGSLGVIVKFVNLEGLFDKIGYKSEIVKSGALKDLGSPDRSLTEEERGLLQKVIDTVHNQFVKAIVESRSLPEEKVRKLADGRIFSGEQAKEYGLIDQFGNLTDAVQLCARLAGLDAEFPHLVYPKAKKFSLVRLFAGEQMDNRLQNFFPARYPLLSYEYASP